MIISYNLDKMILAIKSLARHPAKSEKREHFFLTRKAELKKKYSDKSMIVPFKCENNKSNSKIAAIIHIYYADLAPSIRKYITSLGVDIDLYISTTREEDAAAIKAEFEGYAHGRLEVRVFRNIGRDIAPKLIGFQDAYDKYDYILHLHGKKSLQNEALSGWRDYLYNNLIGSTKIIQSIMCIFENNKNIGIIAPKNYKQMQAHINWGNNYNTCKALACRMGFDIGVYDMMNFPAGSMFWARTKALKPILDLNLDFDDFQVENNQRDGTLAHAIERLYFYISEKSGYDWITIINGRYASEYKNLITIENAEDLHNYCRKHIIHLLKPEYRGQRLDD